MSKGRVVDCEVAGSSPAVCKEGADAKGSIDAAHVGGVDRPAGKSSDRPIANPLLVSVLVPDDPEDRA